MVTNKVIIRPFKVNDTKNKRSTLLYHGTKQGPDVNSRSKLRNCMYQNEHNLRQMKIKLVYLTKHMVLLSDHTLT